MCGITGYFNLNGINQTPELIDKMTDSLIHRGPDSRGIYYDNFAALGHRRLSVIDLKSGNQPMTDTEKSIVVIFNGEIYNFLDLREELESNGFSFQTNSDTEVIVYAYKFWGEHFIEKLNGMFAMAIYDKRKKSLYLYRDRLGIKPLYYTFHNNTFIFSSEPKALFFFPIKREPNLKVMSSYLSNHQFTLKDETLFKNIKILEAAHFLKIDDKGVKINKYWSLSFYDEDGSENYYLEKIRENVEKSTKLRLISDVKLGAFLSGGVDSSILVSIITKSVNENLKTFSIGFENDNFNEFKYSDMINKKYSIEHMNVLADEDEYFSLNEKLIKFKDFPLNVPNEVLIYKLSKTLKDYITVVISGEGADELFGGYGIFLRSVHDYCKLFLINVCPDFFNNDINTFLRDSLMREYKTLNLSSLEEFIYKIYSIFNTQEKNSLFNDDVNDKYIISYYGDILKQCEKKSYYDKFLYFLEFYHLEGLLLRLDNATMAASVEGRVPFLDHNLIEFGYNIPFKYKIKWKNENNQVDAFVSNAREISEKFDITKYILKQSFADKLPAEIANRNKFSFPVPLNEWFSDKFKKYLNKKFETGKIFYEIFNKKQVINFINEPMYGKNGLKTWMLLNLKMWVDEFFD